MPNDMTDMTSNMNKTSDMNKMMEDMMPVVSIKKLSKDSGDEQVSAAISDCIATEVRGGMPQEQAVAACHQMARDKTGKELKPKGGK